MNYRVVALLLLVLSLLPAVGCDKATPVAPNGSILTISANPSKIALNGRSIITVIGRKPDGNPLNPGTEIRMSASLGSIDPIITTDRNGEAIATFRSDGRLGTAKISAVTGGATGGTSGGSGGSGGTSGGGSTSGSLSATVDVQVGEAAKTISLQATPTTVSSTGGTVSLLAIVRDASGQPLRSQGVNFTTDLGRLNSQGAIVQTNANGQARDTLTVSAADLSDNPASIKVSAQTAGGDGALVSDDFSISVQTGGRPIAAFHFEPTQNQRVVQFTNRSTGAGTLRYSWNFGDDMSSTAESPTHTYTADKVYTVQLTVTNDSGSSVATASITIPLQTGGDSH